MTFSIRAMRSSDLSNVYKLEVELFFNPWPQSFFENDLAKANCLALVMEDQDVLLGYALANCCDVELHVTNVAVHKDFQRQGIATRLMVALENAAQTKGCTNAYLEVRTGNIAAIELYKKLGYTVAYLRNQYYIDGDDAYVMQKQFK